MVKVASVSGLLTMGTIAFLGYGFTVRPKDHHNLRDCQFDITMADGISSVEELSGWAGALTIAYNKVVDRNSYPKHCKLYVENELVYVADRFSLTSLKSISYTKAANWDKEYDQFFNVGNLHKTFNVTLELYDEL